MLFKTLRLRYLSRSMYYIAQIKSLLKLLFNTIKRDTIKKHEKSDSHQVKTKNKWLYPEDNFGVLERGKAWSKD